MNDWQTYDGLVINAKILIHTGTFQRGFRITIDHDC